MLHGLSYITAAGVHWVWQRISQSCLFQTCQCRCVPVLGPGLWNANCSTAHHPAHIRTDMFSQFSGPFLDSKWLQRIPEVKYPLKGFLPQVGTCLGLASLNLGRENSFSSVSATGPMPEDPSFWGKCDSRIDCAWLLTVLGASQISVKCSSLSLKPERSMWIKWQS